MKKMISISLAVVFCSLVFSLGLAKAQAAENNAVSHSYIELVQGQLNENDNPIGIDDKKESNVGNTSVGNTRNSNTTGRYPQTNEVKAMGLSFLGSFLILLFFIFYLRRRKKEEE